MNPFKKRISTDAAERLSGLQRLLHSSHGILVFLLVLRHTGTVSARVGVGVHVWVRVQMRVCDVCAHARVCACT